MSFHGQEINQGRLHPGQEYPGEGYAVLRCGGTEVVLGYTLLHCLEFRLDHQSPMWSQIAAAQKALDAITAEASEGNTGDQGASVPSQSSHACGRTAST